MGIILYRLNGVAFHRVRDDVGPRVFYSISKSAAVVPEDENEFVTVHFNKSAIVKIIGDTLYIDLGGLKTSVDRSEFETIEIY